MENNKQAEKKQEQPFFARFLENQTDPKVETNVKAGAWPPLDQTMKWPSDGDEDGPLF